MRAAVLYTGGKDSSFSLHWALHQGFDVEVLVSIIPCYEYSLLYHRPSLEVLRAQSECLGIPLRYKTICDEEEELGALRGLLAAVRSEFGATAVFSGAILSDFQRMRFSMVAEEAGFRSYTPLWRINQEKYMVELVESGFRFLITSISTMGLPPSFLGRELSMKDISRIISLSKRYGFNPAFEGGEAETLVTYMPHYKCRLVVDGRLMKLGEFNYVFRIEGVEKERTEGPY